MTAQKRMRFDPDKFYTEAQAADLPDGNYEILKERLEMDVRGTTVTRRNTYRLAEVDADA